MRRFIPLLATLAVIAVNAAANILPINGVQTGQISARYPSGFTPAGWVFSIWSLIYLGLLAFSLYAASVRAPVALRSNRILAPYIVSCVGNIAWIFMWHHELIEASVACMLLIAGGLLVVYVRLNAERPATFVEQVAVRVPFSLYLGWITTAMLANIAALFTDLGVWPFELARDDWAILSVVTATGIYAAAGVRTGDAVYTAVFCWAALGIVLQPVDVSQAVKMAAAAGCAVALVVTASSLRGRRYGR